MQYIKEEVVPSSSCLDIVSTGDNRGTPKPGSHCPDSGLA